MCMFERKPCRAVLVDQSLESDGVMLATEVHIFLRNIYTVKLFHQLTLDDGEVDYIVLS